MTAHSVYLTVTYFNEVNETNEITNDWDLQ